MKNKLDKQYTDLLQDILNNGVVKSDRTGTGTISIFGRQIRHNMQDGFPLITTKKMAWKSVVTELMWFLKGDTNIKYLVDNDCHIWNGDAYKNYCSQPQFVGHEDIPSMEWFVNEIKNNSKFANKFGNLGSGEVLDKLNRNVEKILMQNNKTAVKDGMDISMLIVDILNKNVNFSGANNPVYIVRKKEEGELILNNVTHTPNISNDKYNLYEIKGDKQPIGAFENRKNYTTHNFTLSNILKLKIRSHYHANQHYGS